MFKLFLQTALTSRRNQLASTLSHQPKIPLFFRGLSTNAKGVPFEKTRVWQEMSEEDRMNCALADSEPQSAEIAFYKGKGLEQFGEESYGEAISAFESATKLNPSYSPIAEKHIGNIYKKLGKNQEAAKTFENAFNHLVEQTMKGIKPPFLAKEFELEQKQSAVKPTLLFK